MIIWSSSNEEDTYKLSSVSKKEISAFEKKLNKTLPDSYKEIIVKQNGGFLDYNAVETEGHEFLEIEHIYGLGSPGLLDTDYLITEWQLPKNILIFSGEGNYWFALDYNSDVPSVIYIEPESNYVVKVAKDFNTFIDKLTNHEFYEGQDEWSKDEANKILAGDNSELIQEVLFSVQYTEQYQWLFQKMLDLSKSKSLLVRESLVSMIRDNTDIYLYETDKSSKQIILQVIETLSNDINSDIVEEISELKDNHSL